MTNISFRAYKFNLLSELISSSTLLTVDFNDDLHCHMENFNNILCIFSIFEKKNWGWGKLLSNKVALMTILQPSPSVP